MAISTNGAIITRLAGALYNEYLSNASYAEVKDTAPATVATNWLTNDFAGKSDSSIATTVLNNLGLTTANGFLGDALVNYVAAQLTAAGATSAAKGAKLVSLLSDFSNLTSDVTYGVSATSFNARVDASLVKSQTTGAAGGNFTTSNVAAVVDGTFTLTTGLDTGSKYTGGAGSDTFNSISSSDATVATFTSADSISGGAGVDTLTVAVSGTIQTAPSVTTNGIEILSLTNNSTGGAYTLDATLMPGLTKLVVNGGLNNVTVNNSGAINLEINSSSKDLTVTPLASAVAGAADTQTITLNGAALSGNVGVTYNGIETVNFVAAGATGDATSDTRLTLTDSALKTANISGAANVRLGLTTSGATAIDAVGVVNASTATGIVDVTVAAGTSALLSVTGGAGNDIVNVGAVTKEMTLAGGAGTDTLVVSSAAKATAPVVQPGFSVSGFETLQIAASGSASIAAFPSNTFTSIKAAGSATVSDLGTAAVTIDQVPATAGGTLTATRATNGTADTITVNLTPTATGTFTGVSIANEETATVRSSGVGTGANTITTLTGTDLKSLTITGDRGLTVTTLTGGTALATLDASANTGTVLSIDASNSLVAMTVKGSGGAPTASTSTLNTITTGSGSDSVTGSAWIDNITTGNGNDTVTAGAGNDTVTAGAGNDVIDGGEGDNNLSGGTGNDSITAGAGNDLIDGGGGSDTINAGSGDDMIAVTLLNTNTSIDGGAGTDRLAATTGTITATTVTSVASAMVPVSDSAAPKMTSVNTAYTSITPSNGTTAAATPVNLDFTGVTGVTTLFMNPIDAGNNDFVKLTNFDGSAITAYGAITNSAELKSLVIDGIGQAALTVTLEDYDTAATTDVFTVTDVTSLTVASRSTSQFGGSSDQNSSLGVVTADGVDTLRITTSGAGAANASALTLESVSATVASSVTLTAGANDTMKITASTGLAAATGLVTSFTATGGVASNFDIDKVNLGAATVATAIITVGEAGAMSNDGNTTIATGQATDFDATTITSLTATVGASGVAHLDLSGIAVTAGSVDTGTSGSTVLVGSLGVASKASSYTFTGRGDLDFDTGGAVGNTVTLLGSTFTFNTGSMSVDNDSLVVNASGLSGAGTITTGIGTDSVTGGASNDSINTGLGADTLDGGAGADTLTVTESLSNQATDVVVLNAANGTSTNSARVQGTSTTAGDDTGEDRIVGFELANDIAEIRATGIVAFVHGDHTTVGTASATTTTGVATEFTKLTLLADLSSTAVADTIAIRAAATGDIAVTFTSPTNSGVAVTDLSAIEATLEGRIRYNLTGSAAANTITGGTQADTIDGSGGADSITGAAGVDSLTGGEGADTVNGGNGNDTIILTEVTAAADQVWLTGTAHASAGNAVDTISGFANTAGQDVLRFGSTFLGFAYASGSINSEMASTSNKMAAQTDKIVIISDNVAGWSGSGAVATFVSGDSGFSSTGSQQAVIIADDGSNAYVWYVNDSLDGTATNISSTDIVLIGILQGTNVAAFSAANFGTAV